MEFIELSVFSRVRDLILRHEEYYALQNDLVRDPLAGDLIQGSGGARKVRVKMGERGKSGGGRAIYYYQSADDQIWFLALYSKKEKSDLSSEEKSVLKQLILSIKEAS